MTSYESFSVQIVELTEKSPYLAIHFLWKIQRILIFLQNEIE